MTYVWQINMIDGKSFYVKTDENNMAKFIESILPKDGKETISVFECEDEKLPPGIRYKYNSVVIVGSKVASVEYFVARKVQDKK